jgi:UDP-N-acetylmuramoyl-L-alanyl-D-glutamate--2,6-diaminopimelate ligase
MYNALAAYAALTLLGMDKEKVKELMKNIEPPRGRFEHFTSPSGVLVIVDYAHTPDALENVLKTIQNIKTHSTSSGRVISVFGCGGDRDPLKRKIMGKIGATLSDLAIFTSDNPRSEDPEKIIGQMKEGLSPDDFKKVKTITNRHEAIMESVKLAQKGDIILCAGKGHEDYQEIKGIKHHFDDVEEFKKAYAK